MEITVGPGGDTVPLDGKTGLRGLPGFEKLDIALVVDQEFDPLDVVFFFHGVGALPTLTK